MRDLTDLRHMLLKAILFGIIAALSAFLLWLQNPRMSTLILLGLCVWACARIYYFLFYVIERYIDPSFRFSGLWSAFRYLWAHRNKPGQSDPE